MKKYYRFFWLCLIASIIELFVFNFTAIASFSYGKIDYSVYYSDNIQQTAEGYLIKDTSYPATIEIYDLSKEAKNVYLDYYSANEGLTYTLTMADEGSKYLYWNKPSLLNNQEKSKYIKLNASGQVERLVFQFPEEVKDAIYIYDVQVNRKVPLAFSFKRFALVLMILCLFYLFKHSARYQFKEKSQKRLIITSLLIVFQLLILAKITIVNPKYVLNQDRNDSNYEYQLLAEAFREGNLYLANPVSDQLQEMDNPYDHLQRVNQEVPYNLDFCYYAGKYYVYFGIVPELLTFFPYYCLFNQHLMNYQVVLLALGLLLLACFKLMDLVIKRYFSKTPYLMQLLYSSCLFWCSGVIELAKNPSTYAIPIAWGLALAIWGIIFWLIAKNKNLHLGYLFLGSLCLALVFGSRPQLGLISFLGLFIFWKDFKNYRALTIALLPYLIIGLGLMSYNYLRFNCVYDFGANYNLTFNDMTHRGFKLDRLGLGLFTYFIQPVNLQATFPFINPVVIDYHYQGIKIYENMFGGLFAWFPLGLISIFAYKFKQAFKVKQLLYLVYFCLGFSLLIAIIDLENAGLVQRYFADFSIFIIFSTIICCLTLAEKYSTINLNYVFFILFFIAVVYSFSLLFVNDFANLKAMNPNFYYSWYYLGQPWL